MYSCRNGPRFAWKHTRLLIASGRGAFAPKCAAYLCTPAASTHARYLDAPCDPKKKQYKWKTYKSKTLCHSFTTWTNIYGIEFQQAWATLKDLEQLPRLIYHKSSSIHSESVPDIFCSVGRGSNSGYSAVENTGPPPADTLTCWQKCTS